MKHLIPLIGVGIALAFLFDTFKPVIFSWLEEVIYWPIYDAMWVGLGGAGIFCLIVAVVSYIGLLIYLGTHRTSVEFDDVKDVV